MKKYIFLDFDGVITTVNSNYELDKEKLDLLGEILEKTDAEIVVSSSWRFISLSLTIENLKKKGFPFIDKIVGVTIRADNYIKNEICLYIPRGVEIKNWLDMNVHSENGQNWDRKVLYKDYNYIILDDDNDMLLEQAEYFIQTDPYLGLSEKDVEKAIEILNFKEK